MLNVPYLPTITNRYTARHDWRMAESGLIFRAGSHTFQVEAILPVIASRPAQALIRNMARNTTFTMRLDLFWGHLDHDRNVWFSFPSDEDRARHARDRHRRREARQAHSLNKLRERVHTCLSGLERIIGQAVAV